jgi:hypothetical protein
MNNAKVINLAYLRIAAEYGHGKRAGVLSDYTFAVRECDDNKSKLVLLVKLILD